MLAAALGAIGNEPVGAAEPIQYCNAVQNRVGFIRYPLGTSAAWSTDAGEVADVMTRVPRIYPCLNSVTLRPQKEDWRASITGDPSLLEIKYRPDKPCGAASMAVTVSPHVSVFRVAFPEVSQGRFLVLDFARGKVDDWAALNRWTNRSVSLSDSRSAEATVGERGKATAYYALKFSQPCAGSGTVDGPDSIHDGEHRVTGDRAGLFVKFEAPTVTVAVAESFTSLDHARQYLDSEFSDFDQVHRECRSAWKQVLNRVELDGAEESKRMAYTALYTMYANLIDGTDGSCYTPYYPRPCSLASSAYWQFIGGFQSCCWDNYRTPYPFLMLSYPAVMKDVLGTYLARYARDGCVDGNICLFTGPAGGHRNIRFSPVLVAEAYYSGVEANYSKLYGALKANFANDSMVPASLERLGYVTQPASGGKACSETLEFATGMHSMAVLAKANHDQAGFANYARLSKCYTNVWDSENKVFRVRNADGSWGVMNHTNWTWNPNPQGLFEGSTKDWMFSVPHDPYGLLGLPGQERVVERVRDYCLNDTWFNDYQYHYPYLLYYAGAANEAQKIIRNDWVPLFREAVMYEGVRPQPPHRGWQTHYTGNAGWLLCSMLGLYPVPTPPGQFIISSPSLSKAVIHARGKEIAIQTRNNSRDNIYLRSIKLDGADYPCYMIPAQRLAMGAKLELEMGNDPARGLGDLYIGSSDGFVREARLVSDSLLKCVVEAAVSDATTKLYSRVKPVRVMVNGKEDTGCDYDAATGTLTVKTSGTANIEVSQKP